VLIPQRIRVENAKYRHPNTLQLKLLDHLADIQNLGSITMSSELVAILEKNKRESYRILGKFLKNNGRNNLKLRKVLEGHSKYMKVFL
jgi:hypothetical protein